jgi:predicted O-methyltransferase YrrM
VTATVPYLPCDPNSQPTGRTTFAPFVFSARPDFWHTTFGPEIDEMTSAPQTLDLLSHLIRFIGGGVVVEVGTYRGWGTAVFAETLRLYELPGHVWSCDPVDHGVQAVIDQAGFTDCVTLVAGTFEDLLPQLDRPMDFCYIDASDKHEAALRLRYLNLTHTHMAPNGVIAVDDAAGEWRGAKTLRRRADLYLPHGRGLALIRT